MAYELNKTDGTILTSLIDGQIDQNSTNLTLVGRNYSGYGEFFNENFIKLLENFANTAAPSNPLTGQTWWNTEAQRLQVYDGAQWKASGGPFVQNSRPQMVAGDLWINNETQQVFAYDGNTANDLILLGPDYTKNQGYSGFDIVSVLDQQSRSRTVAKFFIGNELVGVFSALEFTPIFSQKIEELVTTQNPNGTIFEGFNIVDKANFKWYGTAESATSLVTSAGEIVTAAQFLPSDDNGVTTGTLTIQNSGGLTIGLSQNHVQKIVQDKFFFENQIRDQDISLRVRSTQYESLIVDALYIDASAGKIGIFTTDRLPEYTLDVEGDLRITGNLLVEGDTTSVNVATLTVEDINIELGKLDSGTLGNDTVVENGGIILKSTDSDKNLTWKSAPNAWTSNVNINLENVTSAYKINGINKLTANSIDNSVLYAEGLIRLGSLEYLNVGNLSLGIDPSADPGDTRSVNEIRYEGANLLLSSTVNLRFITGIDSPNEGTITIDTSQKISGVTSPDTGDTPDYVSTKGYVDTKIATEAIVFSMDITGLGTIPAVLQTNVGSYLEDLYPANQLSLGKIARIHTTSYTGATVEGVDVEGIKNISLVTVDADGTLNESVVQDITFLPATGNVVLEPTRTLMIYQISEPTPGTYVWQHLNTTNYN